MIKETAFLFVVFTSCALARVLNHHPLIEYATPKSKQCQVPGLHCKNCTTLVACIEQSDGTFDEEPVAICENSCDKGVCVQNTTDPFCNGLAALEFKCAKVGIFPDPFYCDRFVFCSKNSTGDLVPYRNECDSGYMYNIATSDCDIFLESGSCQEDVYPVPLCKYPGQTGSFPQKRSMYYVCETYSLNSAVLYPVLDQCPGGQEYYNYQCLEATTTPTTVKPTMTTPTTMPPTWTTPPMASSTENNFK